ncbi:MAG TPA: thioredoxin [Candidatus Corynebacterium gallistercoris]|uniref:Thioredoxin n=1 Tax=Candidatus Corynebacterium gallistercoris TaxID=2838530 RepID=A0A9D1RXI8_9CORY|nr:thioredoxin [Candidatus Corynebacterium gallistercoris]
MANVINVTDSTFKQEVVESNVPVLVDFWAEWCGPCLQMTPVIDQLAEEMGDQAKIAKVNVDDERMLAAMFQVMSIPMLAVFKDGTKVAELKGVQSKETLKEKLRSYL